MNEIKLHKKLTAIKLKDGRIITTEASVWQIAEMLNSNDFITIWEVWFWKYEVKTFEAFEPTEIDCFILSQPHSVAKELEKIKNREKRKKGWNWTGQNIYGKFMKTASQKKRKHKKTEQNPASFLGVNHQIWYKLLKNG